MMRQIVTKLIAVATTIVLAGCCTYTSFSLDNKTGQKLTVISGHTGQTNIVATGCRTTMPHTGGEVCIQANHGPYWRYNIEVPSQQNKGCVEYWRRWLIACPEIRLYLAIYPDGTIYAMPIDSQERSDFKNHQPLGYPLIQETKTTVEPTAEAAASRGQ